MFLHLGYRLIVVGIAKAGDRAHSRGNPDKVAASRGRTLDREDGQRLVSGEFDAQEAALASRIAILVELLRRGLLKEFFVAHALDQDTAHLGVRLTQRLLSSD